MYDHVIERGNSGKSKGRPGHKPKKRVAYDDDFSQGTRTTMDVDSDNSFIDLVEDSAESDQIVSILSKLMGTNNQQKRFKLFKKIKSDNCPLPSNSRKNQLSLKAIKPFPALFPSYPIFSPYIHSLLFKQFFIALNPPQPSITSCLFVLFNMKIVYCSLLSLSLFVLNLLLMMQIILIGNYYFSLTYSFRIITWVALFLHLFFLSL